MLEKQAYSLCK